MKKYSPTSNKTPTDGQRGHRGTTDRPAPLFGRHRAQEHAKRQTKRRQPQTANTGTGTDQPNQRAIGTGKQANGQHWGSCPRRPQIQIGYEKTGTDQRPTLLPPPTANRQHRAQEHAQQTNGQPQQAKRGNLRPSDGQTGARGYNNQPNGQNPANGHKNGQQGQRWQQTANPVATSDGQPRQHRAQEHAQQTNPPNGQPCCTHTNPARLLGHEGHRVQPRPTSDGQQTANRVPTYIYYIIVIHVIGNYRNHKILLTRRVMRH